MDKEHINNLYESINKSIDERKVLFEMFQQQNAQMNSTQNTRHEFMLTENFLKSEISDTVEYYNIFVEFLNSTYIFKSSYDRDSQEIQTWLVDRKNKQVEILQKLNSEEKELAVELEKLNSQGQLSLCNKQKLMMDIKDAKLMVDEIKLKIEDNEKLQKDLDEKIQVLRNCNQELLSSIKELAEVLNQTSIDMKHCERDFNEANDVEIKLLTKDYAVKLDGIKMEIKEMEKKWDLEHLNFKIIFDELNNTKKDKELTLKSENVFKEKYDQLVNEGNSMTNHTQILHQKLSEMVVLEKQFENEGTELEAKMKMTENNIAQKQLLQLNKLTKIRDLKADENNNLKAVYNKLHLEKLELLEKQKQKTAISSSQITSSSTPHLDDFVFEITSDEKGLPDEKTAVKEKTNTSKTF